MLINEGSSASMSFYYEKVKVSGGGARTSMGRFREPKAVFGARGNQLCLDRIFTTGIPKEEVVR